MFSEKTATPQRQVGVHHALPPPIANDKCHHAANVEALSEISRVGFYVGEDSRKCRLRISLIARLDW